MLNTEKKICKRVRRLEIIEEQRSRLGSQREEEIQFIFWKIE